MMKLVGRTHFLIISLLFFWSTENAAQAATFSQEKAADFKIIPDNSQVQIYSTFLSPQVAASSPFKKIDLRKLLPQTVNPSASEDLRIQTVFVVRSAFTLPVSIEELKNGPFGQIQTLPQILPRMQLLNCQGTTCHGQMNMSMTSATFDMDYKVLDLRNSENRTWAQENFQVEKANSAQLISLQSVTHWEMLFTDSFGVNFAERLSDSSTLITNYQIHLVKASAYRKASLIPFFNLEKTVREQIQTELGNIKDYFDRSKTTPRAPSSSEYDQNLYRQTSYKLYDPVGDEALIHRAQAVPRNILKALFSGDSAQDDTWKPEDWEWDDPLTGTAPQPQPTQGLSIQGREAPLLLENFKKTLTQVIQEESRKGLPPRIGQFHEWSTQFNRSNLVSSFSKLFICLALGFTDRFMMTGTESSLRTWILNEKYDSVTLPELFRASYRINQGDVYLTLLTIENVLASNWRYLNRENLPITKRLKPITSGYNYKGDRYGTWYHLFGMMLFGYVHHGTPVRAVGKVEAIGSTTLTPEKDQTQKQLLNIQGGPVGKYLRDVVEQRTDRKFIGSPRFLQESYYLNRSEDFRDRLPFTPTEEISATALGGEHGLLGIYLQTLHLDLKSCRVELMFDTGTGFNSKYKITRFDVDISKDRWHYIAASNRQAEKVRGFISFCKNHQGEWRFEIPVSFY